MQQSMSEQVLVCARMYKIGSLTYFVTLRDLFQCVLLALM